MEKEIINYYRFIDDLIKVYKIEKAVEFRKDLAKIIKENVNDNVNDIEKTEAEYVKLLLKYSSINLDEIENKLMNQIFGER